MSETAVVKACLEELAMMGIFAYRQNTGAYKTEDGFYIKYGQVGSSDIVGLLPDGRFLAVECKHGKGKQRKEQKIYQMMVERNKGVYLLVYSREDLKTALRTIPTSRSQP